MVSQKDIGEIWGRVSFELESRRASEISFEDLVEKVIAAAEEVGITGLVARELDRRSIFSEFKEGVIRERVYDREKIKRRLDRAVDLGYFTKGIREGYLTVESFEYNHWVFSPAKLELFFEALKRQGLEPLNDMYAYGLTPMRPEALERAKQREPIYK
mgnify:CR=1 FL=1